MTGYDAIRRAEQKVLMYVYKHDGELRNEAILASDLPSEVDYSEVKRRLVGDHLLAYDGMRWHLTPLGRIYAEILKSSTRRRLYFATCLAVCLSVLSFVAMGLLV